MARTIAPVNAALVQSTSDEAASSICERDGNADCRAERWVANTSLVSEGGIKARSNAKTAAYTVTEGDFFVPVDATAGAVTVTLPAIATSGGMIICIKKIDSGGNAVTVEGNAAETIDGALNVSLAAQWDTAFLICDSTVGWYKIALSV